MPPATFTSFDVREAIAEAFAPAAEEARQAAELQKIAAKPWISTREAALYLGIGFDMVMRQLSKWAARYGVKVRRRNGCAHGPRLIGRASLDRMVERHWR